MTIVFRSKTLDHTRTWSSVKNIRRSGTDWSHLRLYENDDIRDIAWSRSTTDKIYVRDRSDQWWIDIIAIFIGWAWEEFFIDDVRESKKYFLENSKNIIFTSAKKWNYHLRCFSGNDLEAIWGSLLKSNTKWSLILIFRSFNGDINTPYSIQKTAAMNDVILMDIYHPFELHPSGYHMIRWKSMWAIWTLEYQEQRSKISTMHKKECILKDMTYLEVETSENIENFLNYFFKRRYTHG